MSGGPVKLLRYGGVNLLVKLGDYRPNRFRDIQAAHFVTDGERRRTDLVVTENALRRFA